MFHKSSSTNIPATELALRHSTCREYLAKLCPQAEGLLCFNKVSIYYLSGTLANGIFWLPSQGTPVLFVRKSLERARLESPDLTIIPYRSFADLAVFFTQNGGMPTTVACEKSSLSWHMAENLQQRLPSLTFIAGDTVLQHARAIKTAFEQEEMRQCGLLHEQGLCTILPERLRHGMSEMDIAATLWQCYFELGHAGILRMSAPGEEAFMGHICAGDSGIYPSHFNGPLGVRGRHPATPFMGSKAIIWAKEMLLSVDANFSYNGYSTDKTQIYFSGSLANLPLSARKAHETCLEIEQTIAQKMRPGAIPQDLYQTALDMAHKAGFQEGFMGLGNNKVPFLGHGTGLQVDEWPVIANKFVQALEAGMTIALEPKIGLSGLGMVGSENTYLITAHGGISLTGQPQGILCLQS